MIRPRLLFVDDDATFREVLTREVQAFGFDVTSFGTAEEALDLLKETRVDLALFDLRLPGMHGLALLRAALELDPELPVVVLTGHGGVPEAVQAMREGAFDFLGKPAGLDELEVVLRRAADHRALVRRSSLMRDLARREVATEILGESEAIGTLRSSIAKIAASDAHVLVQGESGTGKELVARAIHDASPRHGANFVVANCGAIPESLFESELFGHARGAFTGADRARKGLFELADGGTLFLDEIGELPRQLQPALLRAVQFGEFRPVGDERTERADVRIVAATNRELVGAVRDGEFREDLYHRIATFTLEVPALRDRGGDTALLAEHFLARRALDREGEPKRLAAAGAERLARHSWPGNVRELENVVIRLDTLVESDEIGAGDVERCLGPTSVPAAGELPTLDLDSLERLAIVGALRRHGGNRERAAAEVGIATKTLYNKIRRYGIGEGEWSG